MPDSDHDAGALAGIECSLRIGLAERKRLFAINVLAGSRNGFNLRTMLGVRGRKDTAWIDLSPSTSSREVPSVI